MCSDAIASLPLQQAVHSCILPNNDGAVYGNPAALHRMQQEVPTISPQHLHQSCPSLPLEQPCIPRLCNNIPKHNATMSFSVFCFYLR